MKRLCGKRPKLTAAQVEQARQWRAAGVKRIAVAMRLGVAESTLSRYLRDEVKTLALERRA
jgi:transcriptional regulator with XRE-family HTH domain